MTALRELQQHGVVPPDNASRVGMSCGGHKAETCPTTAHRYRRIAAVMPAKIAGIISGFLLQFSSCVSGRVSGGLSCSEYPRRRWRHPQQSTEDWPHSRKLSSNRQILGRSVGSSGASRILRSHSSPACPIEQRATTSAAKSRCRPKSSQSFTLPSLNAENPYAA